MGRKQPIKRTTATRKQPAKPRTAKPNTSTPIQQDIPLSHPPQHTTPTYTIPTPENTPLYNPFIQPPVLPILPAEPLESTDEGYTLSDVRTQPLTWLWQDRLPRGSVTLLDGPLGSGKSLLALHIAACLTSGQPLPDGTTHTINTLILIAPCTSSSHIIRPRLEAAGGDPSRIHILNRVQYPDKRHGSGYRPFTLTQDLGTLERTIRQLHAPLVILDTPETARPALLRRILPDLTDLAERTNCAILLIRPIQQRPIARKNGTLQPNTDALDLLAAVPSRLLIAPNPDNNQQHLLITSKHTFNPEPPILLFDIIASPSGTPILDWQGQYQPPAPSDDKPAPADIATAQTTPTIPSIPTIPILPSVPNATAYNSDSYGRDSYGRDESRPVHVPTIPNSDVATTETTSTIPSIPILPNIVPSTNGHNIITP